MTEEFGYIRGEYGWFKRTTLGELIMKPGSWGEPNWRIQIKHGTTVTEVPADVPREVVFALAEIFYASMRDDT